MTAVLAFGSGVGLSSIVTVLFVTSGVGLGPRFAAFDALFWIAVAAVSLWHLRNHPHADCRLVRQPRTALTMLDWGARAGFAAVALLVFGAEVIEYLRSPHGQWDAWAIWNQKARFLTRAHPHGRWRRETSFSSTSVPSPTDTART